MNSKVQHGTKFNFSARRHAAEAYKRQFRQVEIYEQFSKKFQYKNDDDWQLPPPEELFKEYYQFENLQQAKQELNNVKSKLNDYGIESWSAHTRRKDPAGEIPWRLKNETKAEFVTVAWCKFFECLHAYPIVECSKLNSLHLCEAPGAFIAALNHYLQTTYANSMISWNWLSTSLNPYYEGNPLNKMIIDDRFMLYTLDNWSFHNDFTGNIISLENIEHMEKQCANRFKGGLQLVTADGSIDCVSAPDCQEEFVDTLHFAELVVALSLLSEGGNFMVKLFTLFEANSVCKMYLLNCVFNEVHVFKPATSKRGNSEVYAICLGYKKHTKYLEETIVLMKQQLFAGSIVMPLFAKKHLPEQFLEQHLHCQRTFAMQQIKAIESNIQSYERQSRDDVRNTHKLRTEVCTEFYLRYKVQPIPEHKKILYSTKGKIPTGKIPTFLYKGSHTERELQKDISREEQIFQLRGHLNDLEKKLIRSFEEAYKEINPAEPRTKMKFYRGKQFEVLQSSLFVSVPILLMHHKLQEIYNVDTFWLNSPQVRLDDKLTINLENEFTASNFSRAQRIFLSTLIKNVWEELPECIVFESMAFITHLSVSLLRYLSLNMYGSISICTSPQFRIILSERHSGSNEQLRLELQFIHNLLTEDEKILCIMDIQQLHRNEFSKALHEYNNLLLVHNFNSLLSD